MVHGCMVYTECAEMAAVSCGTSHVVSKYTNLKQNEAQSARAEPTHKGDN